MHAITEKLLYLQANLALFISLTLQPKLAFILLIILSTPIYLSMPKDVSHRPLGITVKLLYLQATVCFYNIIPYTNYYWEVLQCVPEKINSLGQIQEHPDSFIFDWGMWGLGLEAYVIVTVRFDPNGKVQAHVKYIKFVLKIIWSMGSFESCSDWTSFSGVRGVTRGGMEMVLNWISSSLLSSPSHKLQNWHFSAKHAKGVLCLSSLWNP